jgi:hypothetical protein
LIQLRKLRPPWQPSHGRTGIPPRGKALTAGNHLILAFGNRLLIFHLVRWPVKMPPARNVLPMITNPGVQPGLVAGFGNIQSTTPRSQACRTPILRNRQALSAWSHVILLWRLCDRNHQASP